MLQILCSMLGSEEKRQKNLGFMKFTLSWGQTDDEKTDANSVYYVREGSKEERETGRALCMCMYVCTYTF